MEISSGGNGSASSAQGGDSGATAVPPLAWSQEQFNLAVDLLTKSEASGFLGKLGEEIHGQFPSVSCNSPAEMVCWFADAPTDVPELFLTIQCALQNVPVNAGDNANGRLTAEQAASTLFLLCASRLVSKSEQEAADMGYFVRVPQDENIYCAIIVMALFGAPLKLKLDGGHAPPRADHIYTVEIFTSGSSYMDRIERGVYYQLFRSEIDAGAVREGAGPLTQDQRDRILEAIDANTVTAGIRVKARSIPRLSKQPLALIVPTDAESASCEKFATQYKMPVFQKDISVGSRLLGMPEQELLHFISQFWTEVGKRKQFPSQAAPFVSPQKEMPTGDAPMSTIINNYFNGNAANQSISTGDHSHASSHYGIDAATLASIIDPLKSAFSGLPPGAARSQCLDQIAVLEAEAKNGDGADKDAIQRAFDTLKSAKDGIEGGEKIIEVLTKAYPFLALIFGLPLLP